jgi:predicted outer membrane repeat protein
MKKLALFGVAVFLSVISIAQTISGCTNPIACNYDPTATVDDGSCLIVGTKWVTTAADTGLGSLRQTIADACPNDTIRFDLSLLGDTIHLYSSIALKKDLKIVGRYDASDTLRISGSDSTRIFDVPSTQQIQLDSMYLCNATKQGAAILISSGGTAVLNNSYLVGHSSSAISLNNSSHLTLNHCVVRNNTSGIAAAAHVSKFSSININYSSIRGNSCLGTASSSGGAFNLFKSDMTVSNSTIRGNYAANRGGAIYANNTCTLSFYNSTIAKNKALHNGAFEIHGSSQISLSFCTVMENEASANNGTGGLRLWQSSTLFMDNTLFSSNTNYEIAISNSPSVSNGYNVIEQGGVGNLTLHSTDSLVPVMPMGPLQDNGGGLYTALPMPNSPAIDRGDPADTTQAQNGLWPVYSRDIGAAESNYIYGCTDTLACNYSPLAEQNVGCYYPSPDTLFVVESCDSYVWNNQTYTTSGIYYDSLTNAVGCDSVSVLDLTIHHSSQQTQTVTACGSYHWQGITYAQSGQYSYQTSSSKGCDSILTLQLTIYPASNSMQGVSLCPGDSVQVGNSVYFTTGIYTDTLSTVNSCDSIVHTMVMLQATGCVDPSALNYDPLAVCDDGSCIPTIWGCTDTTACNYDDQANSDDGSCYYASTRWVSTIADAGVGSLRQAVADACPNDTIRFDASLLGDTIHLSSKILLNKDVRLVGLYNATDTMRISGSNATRIFEVFDSVHLQLDSLYLTEGKTSNGAALKLKYGTVVLNNCFLVANVANNSAAIHISNGGHLSLNHCVIRNNEALTGGAGAIYANSSTLNVSYSSLRNNTALSSSATGGACSLVGSDASFSYSTLRGNQADNRAGAVYSTSFTSLNFYKSTIAKNTSSFNAALEVNTNSQITLSSTTIADNVAALATNVGGLYVWGSSSLEMDHSIISENYGRELLLSANSISQSNGHNIVEQPLVNNFYPLSSDHFMDSMPMGPLQDNGGATYTALPMPSTPAVDGGDMFQTASMAQNGLMPMYVRDIGAAETNYIYGCADSTACNYDTLAEHSVGCFLPSPIQHIQVNSCDSFSWNGNTYTQSGLLIDSNLNAVGCDSIVFIDLKIHNSSIQVDTVYACDSYFWQGNTYLTSGVYTQQFLSSKGCDSIISLDLRLNSSQHTIQQETACDQYQWNGMLLDSSGVYTYLTSTANACDSLVTLYLTVHQSETSSMIVEACDSYDWMGQNYDTTGTYVHHSTNAFGCDQSDTLHLSILGSSSSSYTQISACDSYEWNGTTYYTTGLYVNQHTNAAGCEEIDSLHLVIVPAAITPVVEQVFAATLSVTNGTYTSYQWYLDGQMIPGETASSLNISQIGLYMVRVSNTSGCEAYSDPLGIGVSDLSEQEILDHKLYPNPTTDVVYVETPTHLGKEYSIHLYDYQGRELKSFSFEKQAHTMSIDLSAFSQGVYSLLINYSSGDRWTQSIIKY